MTKFWMVLVIACGVVLGNLAWELLGLLTERVGNLVGWVIARSMQKMLIVRQVQEAAATEAARRQRPPIVRETGGTVDENNDRSS